MWSLLALAVLHVAPALSADNNNMEKRQANSADVSSANFLRRGYASVGVLGSVAYIDNGEFSWTANGETQYQYCNVTLPSSTKLTDSSIITHRARPVTVMD
jgi:hypothetical protein